MVARETLSGAGGRVALRVPDELSDSAVAGQQAIGVLGPRWLRLRVLFVFVLVDEKHCKLGSNVRMPSTGKVHESLAAVPLITN
jgi:hypothetical protein